MADMLTINFERVTVTCPSDMNVSTVYATERWNYMLLNGCDPVTEAPNSYTLITFGAGNYLSYISLQPELHQLPVYPKVHHDTTGSYSISAPVAADGVAGLFVVKTLSEVVFGSQGLDWNIVGDHFLSLLLFTNKTDKDRSLRMMEKYYQGVTEYSGTLLRTCVSSYIEGGVPSNMTIPTNGTYYTEAMGWTYTSGSMRWILVPSTVIAFSTIAIVLVALYRHGGEIGIRPFHPSSPMHLMAAAATGGLTDVFRGIEDRDIKEGEKLNVVLGSIPDCGPELVRADEYRSVFSDPFSPGQLTPGSSK
ncbi:hypothetical protein C8J57DRAFT_1239405 [Mycena rebaudengoi]|nr:hypothetical protein C8J57DRAFT_1239405 [Mycena rebaudengoi]